MEMIIIGEKDFDGWPVDFFRQAYENKIEGNIVKTFALARGFEDSNSSDLKAAFVAVRFFIENGERAKKNQKYILGLRFYGFGDMATIDIISLDKGYHREIAQEHVKRVGWSLPALTVEDDELLNLYHSPIFVVGAHLSVSEEGKVSFFDESGDFGGNVVGDNINEIVQQTASLCGLRDEGEGSEVGKKFFEGLLDFMIQNKRGSDFYERFVEKYISKEMTGQNFGGLLMMKVFDRMQDGHHDFIQLLVDEMSSGFARDAMVTAVASQLQRNI